MTLELLRTDTVQEGLRVLVDRAYSMRENLTARVETSVLEDETDLWKNTWQDSKTLNLYGGVNQDNRHQFKIDHDFDLSKIVGAPISSNGSISLDEIEYTQSQGTEFIIIEKADIKGAKADYAIRADKYEDIQEQLNKGKYKAEELEKSGGFKVNVRLKPEEISAHDGWKELAVGKNNASEEDYAEASQFLQEKYIPEAQKQKCFPNEIGMGFYVRTDNKNTEMRPWYVDDSNYWSDAVGRNYFNYDGRFLRVFEKVAEGDVQKISYDQALKTVLESDVRNEKDAAALLAKSNEFYQARV